MLSFAVRSGNALCFSKECPRPEGYLVLRSAVGVRPSPGGEAVRSQRGLECLSNLHRRHVLASGIAGFDRRHRCRGRRSLRLYGGVALPDRLTPTKVVSALAPPAGPALGYRRNHAKGICFTGMFESNGNGAQLSRPRCSRAASIRLSAASISAHPIRPHRMRRSASGGSASRSRPPGGATWRAAMIDLPFFPVATPRAFYELLRSSHSKDPDALKAFAAAHPEFVVFGNWAKSAPWTAKLRRETRFNSNQHLPVCRWFRRRARGAGGRSSRRRRSRPSPGTISPSSAPTISRRKSPTGSPRRRGAGLWW